MRICGVMLAMATCLVGIHPGADGADRPIVAVFKIEDKSKKLSKDLIDQLTDYLGSAIAEGGIFSIVPEGKIREALQSKKKDSHKECYDQSCQIALGQELAASKMLSTTILRIGTSCTATSALFDLKKQTSDVMARADAGCQPADLKKSIDKVAAEIRAWGAGGAQATPKMAAAQPQPQAPAAPSTADYEKMAAQADAQEKQKTREREKYLAALEQAWASVKKVAAAESMEKKARIGMVEKFLADFRQDNPHESEAKALIEQLSRGSVAPVSTAASVTPVTEAVSAGLVWVYSKPAKMEFNKTEITVGQYRECLNAGKCSKPKDKNESKYCNWGHADRDSHPVNCVDWNQAIAFCRWAGGRLPSEQEWFAEASAGGMRKHAWGDQPVTCEYAIWFQDGAGCDGIFSTWPVCSKIKGNSVSGLCDMSGNLWEWTSSQNGSARVVRGGSWVNRDPDALLASDRYWVDPTYGDGGIGFRCGRSSR